MTTTHSRLPARLAALPHDALLALAALGCEQSEAVRAAAEDSLAVHSPFPEWAVETVLLSSDLMPHFFGWFELEQHAVKGVCKAWRGAWAATLEGRRALRPGLELVAPWPQDYFGLRGATPDGERLALWRESTSTFHFFDRQMQSRASLQVEADGHIAIAQDFVIGTNNSNLIQRYSLSGDVLATYEHEDENLTLNLPELSPCGLLFCMCYEDDDTQDEILVFDSHSLQLQHRFGQGLLNNVQGMAIGGGSLYVCDCDHDCIQVFSFAGELLRTIRGEWRRPAGILCVRDRLYLIEQYNPFWDHNEDLRPEGYNPEIGRRVFVMTTAGEALQTYALELEAGQRLDFNMAVFGENLVLKVDDVLKVDAVPKLIALKGL